MTEAMIRKKPGMVSVKDMPVLQDGPPPGGFAPVRYARRIPNTGPSATAIFLAAFGAFSWGMYQVGQGNKIRRALKEEKYAARRAILPVLQAEEDERFVKEWKKYLEYEAEVMKDVPGWKVGESVYHSGRWVPPSTGELRLMFGDLVACGRLSVVMKSSVLRSATFLVICLFCWLTNK
ncbi:NADH dehydrogenase [ubiquinone] 1 alpha subcomplex subunit 13-B-like [Eucalyptus grandis]|uniref:NADH dehydrogenase [ubiquinone] 1 alpha subcomplex subunit 13-B-like n=1 Tax=Eucalyptus grandis TaxID=71139 RepID=UPI00192EB6A5|nr:NADH dehydrogenase [ubiquinone] 1 alpha subcomplex subunit 13-B-like [Eucalyptus grandis]